MLLATVVVCLGCEPSQRVDAPGGPAPQLPVKERFAELVYAIQVSYEKCRSVGGTVQVAWESFGPDSLLLILASLKNSDPDFAGAAEGLRQVEARLEAARSAPEPQRSLALDLFTIQKRECEMTLSPAGMSLLQFRSARAERLEEFNRKMTRLLFEAKLPPSPPPAALATFRSKVAAAEQIAAQAHQAAEAERARREQAAREAERREELAALEAQVAEEEARKREKEEREKRFREAVKRSLNPAAMLTRQHTTSVEGTELVVRVHVRNAGAEHVSSRLRVLVRPHSRLAALGVVWQAVSLGPGEAGDYEARFPGLGPELPKLTVETDFR